MSETGGRSPSKVPNRLVALSSAAVLTVYGAGYLRTRAAAERLDAAERPRVRIPDAPGGWTGPRDPEPDRPDATAEIAAVSPHVAEARSMAPAPERLTVPAAASAPAATAKPKPKPVASDPVATPPTPPSADAVATPAPADATPPTPPVEPTPVPPASVPVSIPPPPAEPEPPPAPKYKDGTYSGWGTSRHGDIKATVVIEGGRIVSAVIAECWTRYSCSWVAHLQGQVVARQSQEVDYVSGATQSANAFYYAVSEALSKAK